jgi:hypothetical protein
VIENQPKQIVILSHAEILSRCAHSRNRICLYHDFGIENDLICGTFRIQRVCALNPCSGVCVKRRPKTNRRLAQAPLQLMLGGAKRSSQKFSLLFKGAYDENKF